MKPFHRKAALVRNLTALPTEIVFKILDDLPVYATLRVACSEDERINDCILKHGKYSALLSPGKTFEELKRYFKLYDEIYTVVQLRKLEEGSILALDVWMYSPGCRDRVSKSHGAPGSGSLDASCIRIYLHKRIWEVLQKAEKHLDVLNHFIDNPKNKLRRVWDYSSIDNLEHRWRTIREAEITLSTIKSRQITRLANLLEKYPDLILSSMDMEQEFRGSGRAKAHHMALQYRAIARKLLLPQVCVRGARGLRAASLFRPNTLPIIPTWESLTTFVAGLENYPCKAALEFRRDVHNQGATENRQYHSYPSDVEEDIRTAVLGMAHVYINPSHPQISPAPPVILRRTENTPYSAPSSSCDCKPTLGLVKKHQRRPSAETASNMQVREEQKKKLIERVSGHPHFCIPGLVPKEPVDGHEGLLNMGLPHDPRELEWLEAYLRVVRYMIEKNLVSKHRPWWKGGRTRDFDRC